MANSASTTAIFVALDEALLRLVVSPLIEGLANPDFLHLV